MNLNYLALTDLPTQGLVLFSQQLVSQTTEPFAAILAPQLKMIEQSCKTLSEALAHHYQQEMGAVLTLLDGQRESSWLSFWYAVLSVVHSNNQAISVAGKKLEKVLKEETTGLIRLGFREQTAMLYRIKEEVDRMPDVLAVALVGRQYRAFVRALKAFDQMIEAAKTLNKKAASKIILETDRTVLCQQLNTLFKDVQSLIEHEEENIERLVECYNTAIAKASNWVLQEPAIDP